MKIAKIVKSNSHVDYVGRVIDSLDAHEPPKSADYGFAQFVSLPIAEETEIVGVIYNSILINPEYANFGPRLSPKPELGRFSPDYLNEQGQLIGILLLGSISNDKFSHGVPHQIVPAGQDVWKMSESDVKNFHTDENGSLQIHYYSQVVAHAGLFAVSLIEEIVKQLTENANEEDKNRLKVLKQALTWQRTVGGMRL
jgi:hypothetical protein